MVAPLFFVRARLDRRIIRWYGLWDNLGGRLIRTGARRAFTGAAVVGLLVSCGAQAETAPQAPLAPAVTTDGVRVAPPPGTGVVGAAGLDVVAADAIHPEVLHAALQQAGFRGGSQRTATGGDGPFARVVVRRLVFATPDGAETVVGWIAEHAATEFFAVEPIATDDGWLLLRHVPDGCCPREVRIYLAAWADGRQVITVKAQGARSSDRAMVSLVDDIRELEGS